MNNTSQSEHDRQSEQDRQAESMRRERQERLAQIEQAERAARSAAARLMGQACSPRKHAAATRNAQKTYKPMKRLADIVCSCRLPSGEPRLEAGELGLPPFRHSSVCLRGRAIKHRTMRKLPLT